jgi:phthalate 4,5-cis-dihydrodiol dehydrogenase
MIGIGIIGGGRICGAHARAALALRETRLAGIAEPDAERRERAAQAFGCPVFPTGEALLAQSEVDAVVVALPHWLHCELTLAALAAGKHVLVEKPMAMTLDECDRMIAAAGVADRKLMVGHHHHYVPVNLAAQALVRNGALGRPVMATDTWYKPFYGDPRPDWFLEARKGGGMWPMNGSHMIDRMTFLIGSPVVAVKARIGNPIYGHSATDMGIAFLEFESGVCATIMHAGYRDGVMRFEAEVTGSEGQLRFTGRQLWRSCSGEWQEVPVTAPETACRPGTEPPAPAFGLELLDFVQSILEGRAPGVTGEYAREIVRVLTACEESSETGREVRLGRDGPLLADSADNRAIAGNPAGAAGSCRHV